MINLNNAEEQKEFTKGPIPSGSMVKLKMTIREPSTEKKSSVDPMLTKPASNNGNDYLNCEFEVVTGTFENLKIWQNLVLAGSDKASKISMATLRAIVEAARNVSPEDASPAATQARNLNSFADLNNMEFPAVVGIEQPKKGDLYINNNIKKIITPNMPEYQELMSGGEKITNTPIPEIPGGISNDPAKNNNSNATDWTGSTSQPQTPPAQDNVPAWAQ